jgi:hypothetical protein
LQALVSFAIFPNISAAPLLCFVTSQPQEQGALVRVSLHAQLFQHRVDAAYVQPQLVQVTGRRDHPAEVHVIREQGTMPGGPFRTVAFIQSARQIAREQRPQIRGQNAALPHPLGEINRMVGSATAVHYAVTALLVPKHNEMRLICGYARLKQDELQQRSRHHVKGF